MSYIVKEISIPTDNDGFVLLQCQLCGEYFKLIPSDIKDESNIEIWCPNCGLKSERYLSEDIIKIALKMAKNVLADAVNGMMKTLSDSLNKGSIKFKAGRPLQKQAIDPIQAKIENLEIEDYKCCHGQAKISPSLKFEGSYCPFCGEINDGN